MKAIIIDDEIIAVELLTILLNPYRDIEITGSYTSPEKALNELRITSPDIVFLDIEMGEINGIEYANRLLEKKGDIDIVFVTAYSQYAVEAFRVNALDYLLKPIEKDQLKETIERLRSKTLKTDIVEEKKRIIQIKSLGRFMLIDENKEILSWRTQKAKELFVYLWKNKERGLSKTIILENIFPDKDIKNGTALLHTTVYQIRKSLEELGYPKAIKYINESYQLNIIISSDIEELDRVLELKEYGEQEIGRILELYTGDFLEEEGYNWEYEEQQKYRNLVMNALEKYIEEQFSHENYSILVRQCLDKIYISNPFNEDIVKKIIIYYGELNKKGDLKNFYLEFSKKLWRELKLDPEESTLKLFQEYMK